MDGQCWIPVCHRLRGLYAANGTETDGGSGGLWAVDFSDGKTVVPGISVGLYVRCVQ